MSTHQVHTISLQLHDLHSRIVGAVSHEGHSSLLQLLHVIRIHLVAMSVPLLNKVMVTSSNLATLIQSPYKAGQTEFAVYCHCCADFQIFSKVSDFIFNTVNIQHFEPHPLSALIRGQGLGDFKV